VYDLIALNRGGETFFKVIPPVPGLGGLTILAFVVQGLFFAASPTGGEGFTAQRFMAARNEFHAQVGQLVNTVLTLIVRVVPFLFFGMIAAALYAPATVGEAGELWARMIHTYAPTGLRGLLVAGVFAAFMAAISAQMNWGASYLINDFYRPLLRPGRSERHYVWAGRVGATLVFALAIVVAYLFVHGLRAWFLFINSVVFAFVLPLSWLRFFWWRLNIYGEAVALVIGLPLSYVVWFPLGFSNELAHPFWQGFLLLFGLGVAIIIGVTYVFPPEPRETLKKFYSLCRPPGLWKPVAKEISLQTCMEIRRETVTDLADCAAGVLSAAASVLAVIALLGRHWGIFAAAVLTASAGGGFFAVRWKKRGVFHALSSEAPKGTAGA
jgi:SSS family solute:Na+ symporter